MGSNYSHPALRQLKEQQARFAPRERRLEQIDRAERLLGEIQPEKTYPYEYLCYRITGFRPQGMPALLLEGREVRHDLRLFVEDPSAASASRRADSRPRSKRSSSAATASAAMARRGSRRPRGLTTSGGPMATPGLTAIPRSVCIISGSAPGRGRRPRGSRRASGRSRGERAGP
jgi:hypothetical protein